MTTTWTVSTPSPEATRVFAACVGQHLQAGDVLWLSGDLGAGKTTFAQGVGHGLQITDPIISPTFVLMREYRGRLLLYHIDLYRLDSLREIENLGLRDYLEGDGVCVLEWSERLDPDAMQPGLHVRLTPRDAEGRTLVFMAQGERAIQLLEWLKTHCGSCVGADT